jgi:hypothetical protein
MIFSSRYRQGKVKKVTQLLKPTPEILIQGELREYKRLRHQGIF